MRSLLWGRVGPVLVTVAACWFVLQRVPFLQLWAVLQGAAYPRFLAAMLPNAIVYFCWDTLVLTMGIRWFHGPVRYRDLLPVRAASYVAGFFNTNAGRGLLAVYLSRVLHAPFLHLGSTVLFLVLTEYLHLVGWASAGLLLVGSEITADLRGVMAGIALVWLLVVLYSRARVTPAQLVRWVLAPQRWSLFRTFRLATLVRYGQIVALRAPLFFASLTFHYLAAPAFGLRIPFGVMMAYLPIIFMVAALPVTVAHLGTTQAAWLLLFRSYGAPSQLVAFSLAAHLTFSVSRALLGLLFLPRVYTDLVSPRRPLPLDTVGCHRVQTSG